MRNKLKILTAGLFPLISIILLWHYIPTLGITHFAEYLARAPIAFFVTILTIFSVNYFLISFRIFLLYKKFGCALSYKDALRTSLYGQVSGLFFIPFLSNMIGQNFSLKHLTIPSSTTAIVCLYERIILVLVGASFFTISCVLLFHTSFSTFIDKTGILVEMFFVVILVSAFILLRGVTHKEKKIIDLFLSWRSLFYFTFTLIVTVVSWTLISSAFVVSFLFLKTSLTLSALWQASFIVSFLASLPISFNGWGVREWASVTVFQTLGAPHDLSLFISIMIGLLSLVSLIIIGFGGGWLLRVKNTQKSCENNSFTKKAFKLSERSIIALLTYGLVIGVFFQIHISFSSVTLNVNAADIIALCGLLIFVHSLLYDKHLFHFSIPYTKSFLLALPLLFLASLLIGFYNHGVTSWALFSKFLGLFVLIGYVGLISLFVGYFKKPGIFRLIELMSITLFVIVITKLIILPVLVNYGAISHDFLTYNLDGYSGNRNAFALQLLVCSCLMIWKQFDTKKYVLDFKSFDLWVLATLMTGVILTWSRSGHIVLVGIVFVLFIIKVVSLRFLLQISVMTVFIICFLYLLDTAVYLCLSGYFTNNIFFAHYSEDSSDHERFYTMIEGLKLWWQYPFFGAGLGRFAFDQMQNFNRNLIIHNTFIWILAEFGLMGFSLFAFYGWQLIKPIFSSFKQFFQMRRKFESHIVLLIMFVTIFGLMGMVHEILYQRILWIFLGIVSVRQANERFQLLKRKIDLRYS